MHTHEAKRFDKRNIESNLRKGIVTPKEYESYLSKLPDVSDKVFNPEADSGDKEEG